MLERIDYFLGGPLKNLTTEQIMLETQQRIQEAITHCTLSCINSKDIYERNIFSKELFDKDYVSINKKNIEYVTSWHFMERQLPTKELEKAMEKYDIEDVLVQLWVYRLGQYSYFATTCTALLKCDDFMAQERIC